MSETDPGGAQSKESSATEDKQKQTDSADKMVRFEDHKRALDDLHKFKRLAQDTEKQKNDLEAKILAEKEDFKTLYERTKNELDETNGKLKKRDEAFIYDKKYNAVQAAALQAGLRNPKDLELLDLDPVRVEFTSEGRTLVQEVEPFVEQLKKERPYWFKSADAAKVNSGGSVNSAKDKPLTPQDLLALERQYKSGKLEKSVYIQKVEEYQKQKSVARMI